MATRRGSRCCSCRSPHRSLDRRRIVPALQRGDPRVAVLATRSLARQVNAPPVASIVIAAASWPAFLGVPPGPVGITFCGTHSPLTRTWTLLRRLVTRARACGGQASSVEAATVRARPPALAAYLDPGATLACWSIAAAAVRASLRLVLSALVLPGWWTPWLGAVASRRLVRSTQQPGFAGLAGDIAGDSRPLAWGAIIVVILALVVSSGPRDARAQHRATILFFGFLALSVGGALYSWQNTHHYLAIGCGVVALGVAACTPSRRAITIATFVLFLPCGLLLWLSAFYRFHAPAQVSYPRSRSSCWSRQRAPSRPLAAERGHPALRHRWPSRRGRDRRRAVPHEPRRRRARMGRRGAVLRHLRILLITRILLDLRSNPRYLQIFYARRSLRILPVYYFVIFASVLFAVGSGKLIRLARSALLHRLHPELLSADSATGMAGGIPLTSHTWTLAVEEQFYWAWPLVVLLVGPRPLRFVVAACVIGAPLARVAMLLASGNPYTVVATLPAQVDALGVGAALALAERAGAGAERVRRYAAIATVAGAALVTALVLNGGGLAPFAVTHIWAASPINSLLLSGFAALFGGIVGLTVFGGGRAWNS